YPLLEEVHHNKFGSLTLALSKLQLSSDRSFTPTWKSMILCSNPQGTTQTTTTGTTSGTTPGTTEVAAVEDLEGITTIEQRRTTKIPLFYRLPAPYRTPYRRRLGNMWAQYRRRPSSLLTYL